MKKWNDGIHGTHLAIAASKERRIAVLAGPGTGKTSYGMMRRVARLLEEGTDPGSILLLSFTRTAAHDLRSKVEALGVDGAADVRATTIHSYCFALLQREAVFQATQRTPRPLLDHEAGTMLRDLRGDYGDIRNRRRLLNDFESGWARQISDHPGQSPIPQDRAFEREILDWLHRHNAMLLGEVVPLAYHYVYNNPASQEIQRYQHVLVDEYQDLNYLEQRLITLLSEGEQSNLCIIGDDDQSIYSFRNANPDGILNFYHQPDVERHHIDVCGRCPQQILAVANELISHAPNRQKPPLTARQTSQGSVYVVQWENMQEEVNGIAAAIARDLETERFTAGEILVLTNRQRIGEPLRMRLNSLGIPAHSFFSQEAIASDEAIYGLAILRMAVSDDPVSFRVILGIGDNDQRADAYARLSDFARTVGESESHLLAQAANGAKLPIRIPALISRYREAIQQLRNLPEDDLAKTVDVLFPPNSLETSAIRDIALAALPECSNLTDLCREIVVRVSQHEIPENPNYVRIMSLHKSKGLTSRSVYVTGMVDGVLPRRNDRQTLQECDAALDEQRRLLYVAITRASEQLVLSSFLEMELGLASQVGASVNQGRYRRVGNTTVAPTMASPYFNQLGPSCPRPVTGATWLASYGRPRPQR